jgi:hypothetical protein
MPHFFELVCIIACSNTLPMTSPSQPAVHCEDTTLFSHLDFRLCRSIYPMSPPPCELIPTSTSTAGPIPSSARRRGPGWSWLEHFRSLGWLPPNYKAKTLEGIAVLEPYWGRYAIPPFA